MPPKQQKQILFKIESPEQFLELISPENKKLVVVDMHLNWCGACNCMESNFRSIFFELDSPDTRIAFYTASEDVIPEEIMTALKHGPLGAKPRFAMWLVSDFTPTHPGRKARRRRRFWVPTSQRSPRASTSSCPSSTTE